jgi:ATP-dependent Clp protease protease subunit
MACIPLSKTKNTDKTIIHLTNDNFVSLRGPVTSQSIAELTSNLLDKTDNERYIYINTNGGNVDAGMHLINVIQDLQNNNINVNCIADTAISMGFVIFQSCSKRYVLSYSTLMQHQMSLGGMKGKLLELNSYMNHVNKMEDIINKMQANIIFYPYHELIHIIPSNLDIYFLFELLLLFVKHVCYLVKMYLDLVRYSVLKYINIRILHILFQFFFSCEEEQICINYI